MEQGRVLATHEDVPDSLRQQLYAAENQQPDQKKRKLRITLQWVQCVLQSVSMSSRQYHPNYHYRYAPPANDDMPTRPDCTGSTMVDGLLGVTVEEYTEWQQRR